MAIRQLGTSTETALVRRQLRIDAADVTVSGIIVKSDIQYVDPIPVTSYNGALGVLRNLNSAYYGPDAIKGFFDRAPANSTLYIKTHVGNTGSAIDAVQATKTFVDQDGTPEDTLTISAGRDNKAGYGTDGNNIGVTITNGSRFDTTLTADIIVTDTSATFASVIGVRVGDIVKIGASTYVKVTGIVESTNTIQFAAGITATTGDAVSVLGFRVRVYYKNSAGIISEVETDKGAIYCTMEPEVTEFYVQNVFKDSKYIIATDESSTSALEAAFPADVSTTTFLESGANGTTPTTTAHWNDSLEAFTGIDVFLLSNPEATATDVNKAGETYCKGRDPHPIWVTTVPESQTYSQLKTLGNSYQRSDEVSQVVVNRWLEVDDPFNNAANAPYREIPATGHIMGAWAYVASVFGVHQVPAQQNIPILGVRGVVGDKFTQSELTDLNNAGVNDIQNISGVGIVIKSFVTPSTDVAYRFANALLMKSFIQQSILTSLDAKLNEPNVADRVNAGRDAIINFGSGLWQRGSSGNSPVGEFFGQYEKEDGTLSTFSESFIVESGADVNPVSELQLGNRNYLVYFRYPAPTQSILISVGIQL